MSEPVYHLTESQLWRRLVDAHMDGTSWSTRAFEARIAEAEAQANRVIAALPEAGITPTPDVAGAAEAEQAQREAAFMAAVYIAHGERLAPASMHAFEAISRIQLYLCGHGDGTPGEWAPWMDGDALASPPAADAEVTG